MRGIYEREPGSNVWWIRYADAFGKIRREKVGSKSAALKLYQLRKSAVWEGRKLPKPRRSHLFRELVKDALVYSDQHKRSSVDDHCRAGKLLEWFDARPADSVTPAEIDVKFQSQDWTPATINRYRSLLSLIYRLANENGKASTNPAKLVRHRRESNGRIRFLDAAEERRLRRAIPPEHLPEFDLALNTGIRRSEQYSAKRDDVDFKRGILTIPESKNGAMRHIPLNKAARRAIEKLRHNTNRPRGWYERNLPFSVQGFSAAELEHLSLPGPGDYLCGGVVSPRSWFDQALRKAGIKNFTWHCLRHTFGSRLVMAGVDIRTVAELMGHKSIQMTMRYSHLAPSHKKAAVERLCRPTGTRTSTKRRQSA